MGERYLPYIVREILEPRDDMRHLPTVVRYIKHKPYGSPKPWKWTFNREQAHVFSRRENAVRAAASRGGDLVRADV